MATNQMDQLKRFNELKAKQARANATNKASDSGNVGQVGQPQKPTQAVRQRQAQQLQHPRPRQTATPAQIATMKAQRTAYEAALKKHISQQKQQTVPKAPVGPPKRNFGIQKNLQPLPKSFRSSFGLPPKKRAGAITDMRGSAGLNQKGRKNSKQYSYSNGGLTRTTDKLKTGIKNGV